MDERRTEIKVGALLLASMAAGACLLWLMGELSLSASGKLNVDYAHTGNVAAGAPVKLAGVQIGRVEKIVLRPDARDTAGQPLPVRMELSLQPATLAGLKADAQFAVATVGPLGEAYLEVDPGSAAAPLLSVKADGALRGVDAARIDLVTANLARFLDAAAQLLEDDPQALANLVRGVGGLAGTVDAVLTENRQDARAAITDLAATTKNLKTLAELAHRQLQAGGTTSRLIDDAAATAAVVRRETPALLGDTRKVMGTLTTMSSVFTEEDAKALKQALTHYSNAGAKLSQLADRADRVLTRIEAGEGTLGGLQKDPQVYQDLKALVTDLKKHPWKVLWKED